MTFGTAVTIVIVSFADSGTMTADFTRWAKNGQSAVYAAFTACPVANMAAQVFGAIIVSADAAAATSGGDFLPLLTSHGSMLALIALIFVFVNLGSVCTHCLYNGAVGWSPITGSKMRILTIALGIIGGSAAIAGVWSLFLPWLSFLGVFVPPIGAVMIIDQFFVRHHSDTDLLPRFPINRICSVGLGRRGRHRRALHGTVVLGGGSRDDRWSCKLLRAGISHLISARLQNTPARMLPTRRGHLRDLRLLTFSNRGVFNL
jgi:cytosine permease